AMSELLLDSTATLGCSTPFFRNALKVHITAAWTVAANVFCQYETCLMSGVAGSGLWLCSTASAN
ncbi:MAG: hypothetical protein ACLGIZ_19020, partial [Acidimicrobiia bacterium]